MTLFVLDVFNGILICLHLYWTFELSIGLYESSGTFVPWWLALASDA